MWTGDGDDRLGRERRLATPGPLQPDHGHLDVHLDGAERPGAARIHTAVWTGTEMIVWGGMYYEQGPT